MFDSTLTSVIMAEFGDFDGHDRDIPEHAYSRYLERQKDNNPPVYEGCEDEESQTQYIELNAYRNSDLPAASKEFPAPVDGPVLCDVCESGNGAIRRTAAMLCRECEERLCDECAKVHRFSKATRTHTLLNLDEFAASAPDKKVRRLPEKCCNEHINEPLNVYCTDCKALACVVCCSTSHKEHEWCDAGNAIAKLRRSLNTELGRLFECAKELHGMSDSVTVQKGNFLDQVATIEVEIIKTTEVFMKLTNDYKDKLLEELYYRKSIGTHQISSLKRTIESRILETEAQIKTGTDLLHWGDSVDIVLPMERQLEQTNPLLNYAVVQRSRDNLDSILVKFTTSDAMHNNKNFLGKVTFAVSAKEDRPIIPVCAREHKVPRTHVKSSCSALVGITLFKSQLFVVKRIPDEQIDVYSPDSFEMLKTIAVVGLNNAYGIASSTISNCIYVSNSSKAKIFKVAFTSEEDQQPLVTSWPAGHRPCGISVSISNNLLVTCTLINKLQEYTSDGKLLRVISLPFAKPAYSVQLANGNFVVTHKHRVCIVDGNGKAVRTLGKTGTPGSTMGRLNCPVGMLFVNDNCLLVADRRNNRIFILNTELNCRPRLLCTPVEAEMKNSWALCLDAAADRLFVAQHDSARLLAFDNVMGAFTSKGANVQH